MTEKTDVELIDEAHEALLDLEGDLRTLGNEDLVTKVEVLHRRLNRCLNRFKRDYGAQDDLAVARSGGGKPDDDPAPNP